MALAVKNLPAMQETQVKSLGQEEPLEEGMATHSSILAWRILWTENLAGYSLQGHKESHMTKRLAMQAHTHICMYVCVCVHICLFIYIDMPCC